MFEAWIGVDCGLASLLSTLLLHETSLRLKHSVARFAQMSGYCALIRRSGYGVVIFAYDTALNAQSGLYMPLA